MAERGITEGEQPPSDGVANAQQSCREMEALGFPISRCMAQAAQENYDGSICDSLTGQDRENCHYSAGGAVMRECMTLEGPHREVCEMGVAIEFEARLACISLEEQQRKLECLLIVASESGNPDFLLEGLGGLSSAGLTSKERDQWIASLAVLTQDYDYLELIEDNRIRDLSLIMVSNNRIGAGRYVAPGVCSQMVGGYSNQDDDLSAESQRKLCHITIAMANVAADYGKTHSMEEILALQNGMAEYWEYLERNNEIADGYDVDPLPDNFDPDALLPPGIREALERALAEARSEFAAASVTQSGYTEPPPSPSPPAAVPGRLPDGSYPMPTYGGETCLYGLC